MIEFDVETDGLQAWSGNNEAFLWIFSSAPDCADAEAIPFTPSGSSIPGWEDADSPPDGEPGEGMVEEWRSLARDRIQWWFDKAAADPEGIRAWNSKFDRAFAEAAGCFNVPGDGKWHDGMLVAQAINENRSVALKAVASSLFGEEAAGPQKALKAWLHAENARRRRVVTDASKIDARIAKAEAAEEKAKAAYQRAKRPDVIERAKEKWEAKLEELAALNESKPGLLAEAATYQRDDNTFVYANYSHVPQDIMEPYALEDVILTRKVSDVYAGTLVNQPDLKQVYGFERAAMDALYAVEKRGLPAHERDYRRLEQEVLRNIDRYEERVRDLVAEADPVVFAKAMAGDKWGNGGHMVEADEDGTLHYHGGAMSLDEFSPQSSAHILAALKARGADMQYMSQKDGKIPCDADNLRAVDDELAVAILDFRSEYKVLSTYVRPMIGRSYVSEMNTYKEPFISAVDSRIHATYRQVGARTGRMSCADPNMQNQPRDDLRLRYNIVADPGYVLVTCDLTNIEMVLFAAYCGEGRLLNAVRNGDDLHTLTAKMLGFRDRRRPGGGIETARQQGKTYNFSRIYGGGLRTIRRSFRCSLDEARLLKRRFDEAYPEATRLSERIEFKLQDDGYVQDKLISGRRFRVDERDSYKAVNYLIQGTAAALLKYAVIQLHKDGVPMVALVHDEIVAHVPKADAVEAGKLIEERMTEFEGLKGIVPLRAEADIVKRWSDAKPLKDERGQPYLFTPEWDGGAKRPVPTTEEVLLAA